MGLPVNTASRIQTLAKPYQILIDYKLRKKIGVLQKNEKFHEKIKKLKISFSEGKLRNLRGLGQVKISEIRWDKFYEIQKEENDLTQEQLKDLSEILTKNKIKKILQPIQNFVNLC